MIFGLFNDAGRLDQRLRVWSLVGWCMAWLVVTWAMLDPSPPTIGSLSDKVIHFSSFCAVSFAAIAFCRSTVQLAMAGLVCAIAGVGFELAQAFVPPRGFEWGDIAANLGGTVTGILLAAVALRGLRKIGWPPRREPSGQAARGTV